MTDSIPSNSFSTPQDTNGPTSPQSGAVDQQHPALSYANATKTAEPTIPPPAGASTPSQDAKIPSSDAAPVNGVNQSMAQGAPQPASTSTPNGNTAGHEHSRKASVIINASGASGHTPNGGPISQGSRPPINFGSMNAQGSPMPSNSMQHQSQGSSSLPTPPRDPRASSPAHSPSPIPQPSASGGRPPSGLQGQTNGMPTFGSIGGDGQQMQHGQMPPNAMGPGMPVHERRQSSNQMHGGAGRGRGGYPGPQGYNNTPSPNLPYRQLAPQNRSTSGMGHQFQQQMQPGSPYQRGRGSPAVNHSQPNMSQMGGNPYPQQQYQYPQQQHSQHQNMYGMQHYDPQTGYYQPYYPNYGHYPNQGAPSSPRYPTPFGGQQPQMQPPYAATSMSRSASQASERPSSSMGQAGTPSMQHSIPTSQTPSSQQTTSGQSQFVKPSQQKKSSAIKITDANGNLIEFNKPKPSPTPSNTSATQQERQSSPLVVGATKTATPPPRVPSAQHNRAESKPAVSAEDTRTAFLEQVKRRQEEEARKEAEEKAKAGKETTSSEAAVESKKDEPESTPAAAAAATTTAPVKEAAAEAEKAAATDVGDKEGEKAADAAASAATKDEGETTEREETEDERTDRMIAEMEANEREEEERAAAYAEKQKAAKAEKAKRDAEASAKADEELKRQEREAEEREAQREREREEEDKGEQEPDQESKDLFSALKKPTFGPGATESGDAETPKSEDADSASMPPPGARSASAQKPKPAHLKLETAKRVEAPEPTPGMQALKSARFLAVKEEACYPNGIKSPNPALNQSGSRKARSYDKDFLLQFQNVFKEKPSIDWDQKVKETLGPGGDEPGSARPQSGNRTPSSAMRGGRSASNRPSSMAFGGSDVMGSFQNRTIPAGSTSEQRFMMSSQPGARSSMGPLPGGPMGRTPNQLGMPMARTASVNSMGGMGASSPGRAQSGRGPKGGSSRRGGGDRAMSRKEEMEQNSKMPLTAHLELKGLEKSSTGWKASSLAGPSAAAAGVDPDGHMAPDLVQRKVKAALNKMTPENFDRIADQILKIASQSEREKDGRTLRQVIQLTFEKACDEAHWAGMYAQFCHKMLTTMSSEIRDETIKDKNGNAVIGGALFRKYLLNRCQEEFERGWQVNLPDKPEGDSQEAALMSDEYYVAAAAKRRGLGLIQFIGQLYKLRMLTLRIMHECVLKLLNFEGDPDEAAVENLTTLLKSVGPTMDEDEQQGHNFMNAYFQRIDDVILKSDRLPSRPKFMIMDLVDLRKKDWKGKDASKGPKTISQIHEEAEAAQARADAERQRQSQRGGPGGGGGRPPAGRGDARQFSGGGIPPPTDFNRVSNDDIRRLHRGTAPRTAGTSLGPGGSLLSANRSGSRRGAGGLGGPGAGGPGGGLSSGNTTRTNTPPVDSAKEKKEEGSSAQQNAFSALASLDPSGEGQEEATPSEAATSPPATRDSNAASGAASSGQPQAAAEEGGSKPDESSA